MAELEACESLLRGEGDVGWSNSGSTRPVSASKWAVAARAQSAAIADCRIAPRVVWVRTPDVMSLSISIQLLGAIQFCCSCRSIQLLSRRKPRPGRSQIAFTTRISNFLWSIAGRVSQEALPYLRGFSVLY